MMQCKSTESPSEFPVAVQARAERQHAYRAHAFTCATCFENEEALCAEGHRLLVEALKPV